MRIKFPRNTGQRYYDSHFKFMLNLFEEIGWPIEHFDDDTGERGCFRMFLNDKPVMFDFSDYGSEYQGEIPCIRMHVKRDTQKDNIFPFSPCSFWNWNQYREFAGRLKYTATGLVMHNQYPHCNNTQRRTMVRRMVDDWADKKLAAGIVLSKGMSYLGRELNGASTQYYGVKEYYWNSLKDCLISIHVPGQNNNMLDAAQLQLMGFGYCTISPYLPEVLPFGMTLTPGREYIQCEDDYSDLVDKIELCRERPAECLEIGRNAKALFDAACSPASLKKWLEIVEGFSL